MSPQEQGILALAPSGAETDAARVEACKARLPESLRSAMGGTWWIVDTAGGLATTAEPAQAGKCASDLPSHWLAVCSEIARRGKIEFIADDEPLLGIAVPTPIGDEPRFVAVGIFLSSSSLANRTTSREQAARILIGQFGWQAADAERWFVEQIPWPAERLRTIAELVASRFAAKHRIEALASEAAQLSAHLTDLYEEISLWHRLTRHLRISENEEELGRMALEWLSAAVPAESLVLQLLGQTDSNGQELCSAPAFLARGNCPLDENGFNRLIRTLKLDREVRTVIANPPASKAQLRTFPEIRHLIVVPLAAGEKLIGWLAALNHSERQEFGSPEASLLASVGAILGIHAGNLALYRQQAEMLSGIVRALTSAIDAKDPYTCGHSDRVARISVALATELGLDRKQLETLYLSGLLHDIGKIGIDDSVLRKPGRLSDNEYEHIKLHPEIGYRILHDLKQLGEVLPVVRHHHEAWDGRGYPARLAGAQIPQMARIVAVADAFDAMSSDRPYRKGMDNSRLETILREGAGKQWDAEVVAAFFRIRDKIGEICGRKDDGDPNSLPEELRRMT
jgi:HD domain